MHEEHKTSTYGEMRTGNTRTTKGPRPVILTDFLFAREQKTLTNTT